MLQKEEPVPLDRIHGECPYKITTDENISALCQAIMSGGLLKPCVFRQAAASFVVVAGHKRVRVLKRAGVSHVPGRIVTAADAGENPDAACARIAVMDNAFERDLNTVEIARSVRLLQTCLSAGEIGEQSVSIFNKELNETVLSKYARLGEMPAEIHDLILQSRLSFKSALQLSRYSTDIVRAFATVFRNVRMSQNKQLEVITCFHEIALRDDIPLLELMTSAAVENVVRTDHPDENHKGNALRAYLLKRRFPEISRARETFQNRVTEINPAAGIKLAPPVNFEGETFSVSFEFKNRQEFTEKVENLQQIKRHPVFKKIVP